ncbi:hypothetical protein HDK64DRAFT_251158 [Phyllosticta capitalensis]
MTWTAATHRALDRILEFGVYNLLDDKIQPREVPVGRRENRNRRWVRLDEPDTRILEPQEWPENTVIQLDKIIRIAHDKSIIKPLLIKKVRERQNDDNRKLPSRMIREVNGSDLSDALRDIQAQHAALGKKRKQRADSPLQGQMDGQEEPPMKKHQSLSRAMSETQKISSPNVNVSPGVSRPMKHRSLSPTTLEAKKIPSPGVNVSPGVSRLIERQSLSPTTLKTKKISSPDVNDSSSNVELPTSPSSTNFHAYFKDTSPGDMVTAAYFNNESDEKWLLVLLKSYISRLEDIQKVIRPTQYKESEQATFASHMIAASKLGYSTHDLNITSSSAFLDTYVMLLDDDRTQLLHLRAVIEMNVRKLCGFDVAECSSSAHVERHTKLYLDKELEERIAAVLA